MNLNYTLIGQMIFFAGFVLFCMKYVWPPIMAAMSEREKKISDGLAADEDMKIPKFAEEAIYMHIAHAILSVRSNIPEYVINRFKKDRRAALRNAKIRLSNIKIEEIAQVFRNKSKIIKH